MVPAFALLLSVAASQEERVEHAVTMLFRRSMRIPIAVRCLLARPLALGAGPAVAAAVGITFLVVAGTLSIHACASTWTDWWVQEASGVLFVAPLRSLRVRMDRLGAAFRDAAETVLLLFGP